MSCSPLRASAGGSSIVRVCWVSGPLSLGCSFGTLSAAQRDMHTRPQPHEQITSQRGVSEVIEGRRLGADEGPVIPLMWEIASSCGATRHRDEGAARFLCIAGTGLGLKRRLGRFLGIVPNSSLPIRVAGE